MTQHVHFIGIGGISMSSLACILQSRGYVVSGSDLKESAVTRSLREKGIEVMIGQKAENITPDIDIVVFTAAVHEGNPELMEARRIVPRVIERAVLLGELMAQYEHSIGIAGTHGKTSTSTMLSYILLEEHADPTITIGGILENLKSNYRIGHSDYFVAEACEYSDSFLQFHPETGIILNVEAEHLDYFKTYDRMADSFRKYVYGYKTGGALICNYEYIHLFPDYQGEVTTVSLKDHHADLFAGQIEKSEDRLGNTFSCYFKGELLGNITLKVPGEHIIFDALCAVGAALHYGIPFESIQRGLAAYRSPKKRFEFRGTFNQGTQIIDDYAHHPTEIAATLVTANDVKKGELYVVFQPHTYSRTKMFYQEFIKALSKADHVILTDIYAAREKDPGDVSSRQLALDLAAAGTDALYFPTFDEIAEYVRKKCCPQDLLITMGAGEAVIVAEKLLAQ